MLPFRCKTTSSYLNIVECKYILIPLIALFPIGSYLNIVECKLLFCKSSSDLAVCSYLNIIECKYSFSMICKCIIIL